MELTQEQIQQLKAKGLDDAKIASLARQNGYTLPQARTLSMGDIAELKARGLDDTKIQTLAQQNGYVMPDIGGVQSFAQSIASPFKKVGATLYGGALGAGSLLGISGAEEARQKLLTRGIDLGYLGQAKPIGAEAYNQLQRGEISGGKFVGKAGLDLLGTAAEVGSYAIGGGGVAKTVATGLKGQIARGALQGTKYGALGGGTMSFGQAIQEAETTPSEVAYKTMFGTALGGAAGGVLGAIAPVVVKTANMTKRFTNINEINAELQNLNTQVLKPKPSELEKWSTQGKDPMKTYTEIFGTETPLVGYDNRFTKESIDNLVERVNDLYNPASESFNTILRNSPEVNSLSKAREMAIKNLDAYNLTPEMQQKAIQKIDSNFQSVYAKAKQDGVLLGDDSIPVWYTDNLKDRFWKATRNFGTEDATIANSVNGSIGHGFKESIENSIQDIGVKDFNKQLGDLIVLRDFLETKAGASSGTGGKMTRLMGRVAGSVIGSDKGIIGSILGTITGDKLAQIMINPAMQPYRWIIRKKLAQLPQPQLLKLEQEANEVIKQMFAKRQETILKYSLPPAAPRGTSRNPIITPNTQGTPNPVVPGSTGSDVGGIRQRLP